MWGRTIHSDGTVIPLTAKSSDLMDFKSKKDPHDFHQKVAIADQQQFVLSRAIIPHAR
jgi:hypothetical protein